MHAAMPFHVPARLADGLGPGSALSRKSGIRPGYLGPTHLSLQTDLGYNFSPSIFLTPPSVHHFFVCGGGNAQTECLPHQPPPAARTAIPQAVSGILVSPGAAAPLARNPRIPAHIILQIINGINKILDKFIRGIQVMPRYRQRHIESKLREYSKYFKAILVTGARQVGKSNCSGICECCL